MAHFYPLFLNLMFVFYILVAHPFFIFHLNPENNSTFSLLFGLMLIVLQILEYLGLLLKRPLLKQWYKTFPKKSGVAFFLISLTALTHFMITAVLTFNAIHLITLSFNHPEGFGFQLFSFILFFIALVKEFFFFLTFLDLSNMRLTKSPLFLEAKDTSPPITETKARLGDFLCLVFAMITFTSVWDVTSISSPLENGSIFYQLWQYFGATLFFLMTYPSSRILFTFEQLMLQWDWKTRVINVAGFLLTWISVLISIPR